jgi:lysophospholipase L1-like esterase
VSRAGRARRIATAAAYGGGGIGAAGAVGGAALWGLLVSQSRLARRRIPQAETDPPSADQTVWRALGVSANRRPITMVMLGDSLAAGYGVDLPDETPAVVLARGVSAAARRPIRLRVVAVVGAESQALPSQLARLADDEPFDLAVIMIGANDVTHRLKPADCVRHLSETVAALRGVGTEVVVGTCPDLGTIRPIAQPLRYFVRRMSRNLAAAQTIGVVQAGGRTVSLGDLLGPLFAERQDLFGADRFHPSATGYQAAASAVLPSCLDALGLSTRASAVSPLRTRRARPLDRVAADAAVRPGAEVAATEVRGETSGRRGPWARLRLRRAPRPTESAPAVQERMS